MTLTIASHYCSKKLNTLLYIALHFCYIYLINYSFVFLMALPLINCKYCISNCLSFWITFSKNDWISMFYLVCPSWSGKHCIHPNFWIWQSFYKHMNCIKFALCFKHLIFIKSKFYKYNIKAICWYERYQIRIATYINYS